MHTLIDNFSDILVALIVNSGVIIIFLYCLFKVMEVFRII